MAAQEGQRRGLRPGVNLAATPKALPPTANCGEDFHLGIERWAVGGGGLLAEARVVEENHPPTVRIGEGHTLILPIGILWRYRSKPEAR